LTSPHEVLPWSSPAQSRSRTRTQSGRTSSIAFTSSSDDERRSAVRMKRPPNNNRLVHDSVNRLAAALPFRASGQIQAAGASRMASPSSPCGKVRPRTRGLSRQPASSSDTMSAFLARVRHSGNRGPQVTHSPRRQRVHGTCCVSIIYVARNPLSVLNGTTNAKSRHLVSDRCRD
jgi:hypothetical protein